MNYYERLEKENPLFHIYRKAHDQYIREIFHMDDELYDGFMSFNDFLLDFSGIIIASFFYFILIFKNEAAQL